MTAILKRFSKLRFHLTIVGIFVLLKGRSAVDKTFRNLLSEQDANVGISVTGEPGGWILSFTQGRLRIRYVKNGRPTAALEFGNYDIANQLLTPPIKWSQQVHALKNFDLVQSGSDTHTVWFARVVLAAGALPLAVGTLQSDGTTRMTTMTNGGPIFVYIKNGKIVRTTPMDLEEEEAGRWSITAHGRAFSPPPRATVSPHALTWKGNVYSKSRILTPLRRVDFDPKGERNPAKRGKSEYVPISWEEALDIVASEITRARTTYGASSITFNHSSHHSWGNIGYWTSALLRFSNIVGHTKVNHNPDSWEGWFWGASHHWGQTMRLGAAEAYGTVEDLLANAEMVVFWSADPEATNGIYGGQEGTIRRLWLKELGIPIVHIDPYFNNTAAFLPGKWIAPRPGTDAALALAIAHTWITEGLYDKSFVRNRTTGFETWSTYILGESDGTAKTPEWQEAETGVLAETVRALARQWGSKRTYLGAGGWGTGLGGAGRGPTGHQWARAMVCLNALQGFGKPGVNFGHLQWGTPLDLNFWFPGYADGGISGDLANTTSSVALYQRMPHLPSMNSVAQQIPRMRLPEGIIEGNAQGFPREPKSLQGQFNPIRYPAPGASLIKLYYKYGSSNFGTMAESHRYADMYRSENLEFVVNQSIWMEGDAGFADVILPSCTSFERWDISEWASLSGFGHHAQTQLNNRIVTLQHKCIEPLGESKSDYDIFALIAGRLGMGALFTEGMTELDWVKRMYEASDLKDRIGWRKLLKKGYYVVPQIDEIAAQKAPKAFSWFYQGRTKDTPEPHPLPSEHTGNFRMGLQTRSGKFEFEASSLVSLDAEDRERPPTLQYVPSWEGLSTDLSATYPLQLITPHPRFSFHTESDGRDSFLNAISDHRVIVDGYPYIVLRVNVDDARERGIRSGDLVRAFNDRGTVICVAKLTHRLPRGITHGYESSALYDPVGKSEDRVDRGGSLNTLSSKRPQVTKSHSLAASNCLVQLALHREISPHTQEGTEAAL